jgi:hypothetical protein
MSYPRLEEGFGITRKINFSPPKPLAGFFRRAVKSLSKQKKLGDRRKNSRHPPNYCQKQKSRVSRASSYSITLIIPVSGSG